MSGVKTNFKKICRTSDLKENVGSLFMVNDIEVAVFKVKGEIYALDNICPHQKIPMIYEGFIENGCVVCPIHGWEFDLKTGNKDGNLRGLKAYPVDIIDDEVYLLVEKKELNW